MPPALLAASDSSAGLSVPLLLAAGVAALLWMGTLVVAGVVRRPPRIATVAGQGLALPPEPPAVAGLLCDDFVVGSEAAPATLLDLAARRVVVLEEVQPGNTICRLRDHDRSTLTGYERMVVDQLRTRAIDGVVPTDALTTGTDDVSRAWHRDFARHVVADAKARGLTVDRWPARIVGPLGWGVLAVVALLIAASAVGGDANGDVNAVAVIAAFVAVLSIPVGVGILGRLGRSLAQLPTESGIGAAATARALQRTLQEQGSSGGGFTDLAPAAVVLWDRVFAYAAAMGAARRAVTMLALGAEDDHRAWSGVGGRWRRVHVRYPRAWPPAWGKHPMLAILLALAWGGAGVAAIYWLARLASEDRDASLGFSRASYDWVDRLAFVGIGLSALLVVWAVGVLVRAVPDLWARRTVTGEIVRDRRRTQVFASGNDPKYWYYIAVDDGSSTRVRAWRIRAVLWQQCHQGEQVVAEITPGLAYVRSIRGADAAPGSTPPGRAPGAVTG